MNTLEIALAKRARLLAEMKKLDSFIAMAEELEREATPAQTLSLLAPVASSMPVPAKKPTIKDLVLDSAEKLVTMRGAASTAAITEFVVGQGIDPSPTNSDKKAAVAVMLSKAKDRFANDKTVKGWRINPGSDHAVEVGNSMRSINGSSGSGQV